MDKRTSAFAEQLPATSINRRSRWWFALPLPQPSSHSNMSMGSPLLHLLSVVVGPIIVVRVLEAALWSQSVPWSASRKRCVARQPNPWCVHMRSNDFEMGTAHGLLVCSRFSDLSLCPRRRHLHTRTHAHTYTHKHTHTLPPPHPHTHTQIHTSNRTNPHTSVPILTHTPTHPTPP